MELLEIVFQYINNLSHGGRRWAVDLLNVAYIAIEQSYKLIEVADHLGDHCLRSDTLRVKLDRKCLLATNDIINPGDDHLYLLRMVIWYITVEGVNNRVQL